MAVRVPSCVLSGRARPGAAGRVGQPVGAESLNARQGMPFRHAPPWGGAPPRSAPHTPASHGLCACPPSRPPCPARPSPRRARGSGGRARTRISSHPPAERANARGDALGGLLGGSLGGSHAAELAPSFCRASAELAPSLRRELSPRTCTELAPSLASRPTMERAYDFTPSYARPWSAANSARGFNKALGTL